QRGAPKEAEGPLPSVLVRQVPDGPERLSFPPEPTGRRARRPLDPDLQDPGERELEVIAPSLDGERSFQVHGKSLGVTFNQPMKQTSLGGNVILDPPVVGRAHWDGDRTVRFSADAFFDPDRSYRITLEGLESAPGKKLHSWSASF